MKISPSVPLAGAFAIAIAGTLALSANPLSARKLDVAAPPAGAVYQPNEVLVRFERSADDSAKARAFRSVGGTPIELIQTPAMQAFGDTGYALVRTSIPVDRAMQQLRRIPGVADVEPNWVYTTGAVSNDPYYTNKSLWGMYGASTTPANTFGTGAAAAWAADKIGSDNVYVGVIDTGVMVAHSDLKANIWVNPFDKVDGIDNDGNGYIDDTNGWDFNGRNRTVFDGLADDHGTHVAGTIGGVGGNGIGVAGMCWKVKIITGKFLGSTGGTTANAIKAIDYMVDLKLRHGINIVALNNSWGGGGYSKALQDAIERANQANILFVAAASNDGLNNDTTASYPSNYTNANVIAVASITSGGALSSFSNYGATTVDLGAPGSGIWSTVPLRGGKSGYASYSGTSMATPHVTGAAALFAASRPVEASTAAAIKSAILGSTTPTASLSGKTVTGGRLNVTGF